MSGVRIADGSPIEALAIASAFSFVTFFSPTHTMLCGGVFMSENSKVHIIGIGGAGMTALADYLMDDGYNITGSDCNHSDNTKRLRDNGVKIHHRHDSNNIGNPDFVIYSAAIMDNNKELKYAKENHSTLTRADAIDLISHQHENVIGVSGTHGKTTTTAMISHVLLNSGINPSVLLGGKIPNINKNGRKGENILVCEACEFAGTFLQMKRDISVILNIDADHLECYKTMDNLEKAFCEFAKESKVCFCFGDEVRTLKCGKSAENTITFGFSSNNDWYANNIANSKGKWEFDVIYNGEHFCHISLNVPGKHNILNTLATVAVCDYLGVSGDEISKHVNSFKGVARRFEIVGKKNGITVADDYAHHPTEISALANSAREMGYKKNTALFQPFTFSRTHMLKVDFIDALSNFDRAIITDIMGSREINTYGISSKDLCVKDNFTYRPTFEEAKEYILKTAEEDELIITIGCGDIYKCGRMILEDL